jgi:hypothetical protein
VASHLQSGYPGLVTAYGIPWSFRWNSPGSHLALGARALPAGSPQVAEDERPSGRPDRVELDGVAERVELAD